LQIRLYKIRTVIPGFSKHSDDEILRNIEGGFLTDALNETKGASVIKNRGCVHCSLLNSYINELCIARTQADHLIFRLVPLSHDDNVSFPLGSTHSLDNLVGNQAAVVLYKDVESVPDSVDLDRHDSVMNPRLQIRLFHKEIQAWTATGAVFLGRYSFGNSVC